MTENEYKFLADREGFGRLLEKMRADFPAMPVKEQVQVNYYYDTDSFELQKRNITLRARQTEEGVKLEVKEHMPDGGAFRKSEESAWGMLHLTRDIWVVSLENMSLDAWHYYRLQGTLTTQRTTFRPKAGVAVMFDKNFYLGICDYEIEIEFAEEAALDAEELIKRLELKSPNGTGKAARFFQAKERLESGGG